MCRFFAPTTLSSCHLVIFALATSSPSAPAPIPPPKAPAKKTPSAPAHQGAWHMRWASGSGPVIFSPDGGYWCLWSGAQWVGSWRLIDGRLQVREAIAGGSDEPAGRPIEWSVRLDDSGIRGLLESGQVFELTKP